MTVTYGVYPNGGVLATVTTDDGDREYVIPPDEGNTDYAEYLAWVEAGNTADELPDPLEQFREGDTT